MDFPTPPLPLTTAITFLIRLISCGCTNRLSAFLSLQFSLQLSQFWEQFSLMDFLLLLLHYFIIACGKIFQLFGLSSARRSAFLHPPCQDPRQTSRNAKAAEQSVSSNQPLIDGLGSASIVGDSADKSYILFTTPGFNGTCMFLVKIMLVDTNGYRHIQDPCRSGNSFQIAEARKRWLRYDQHQVDARY